jgi:broad specificity phosphatase PhoE
MRLFLIRHGETDYTATKRLCGVIDASLNRKGVMQARKLARQLRHLDNKVIYASPMRRACQTARIICGRNNGTIKITKCKELVESNLGKWEGLTFDEIRDRFPVAMKRWVKQPFVFGAPGGEKLKQLQKRVRRFLKRLESTNHNGKTVVVVTHSGPIRIILGEISGRELKDFWKIEPKTGCLIKVSGFPPEAGQPLAENRLNRLK